jgi:hypothetical protein
MAVFNTYNDISAFVNTLWGDVMFVARENNAMSALVTTFTDTQGMAVRKNTKYGSVTIGQINEQDDLAGQAFTPSTDQTLTPYEYGAQFALTDQRVESDIYTVRQDAANELGRGIGQKVDILLAGLFSSLTGGTVGGTSTNLTWANFFAAESRLRAAYAPQPYICVLHPYQWHCLGTSAMPGVTVTNSPTLQDEIANRWFVGNAGGVDIYLDGNISAASSATYGAMFSSNAMALDWRRSPRIEPQRDASRRLWELNLSAVFAYGVWRPQFGICINTAGTAPV